ncbi:MAG: M20/M25/M40 family metallo-hydrolase [Elusimicrobiota bacterium]
MLLKFLKDLIEIPSLSGKESGVAARVREEFEKLDYDEVIEAGGNICGKKGRGKINILYDAHMDVVEPGSGWTTDPYRAVEKDGYIYGRGACDDKGSLAAIIHGGASAAIEDTISLYVLASVREEITEGNGMKEFLSSTGINPDYVVIAEPSSLRLARGNRGRLAVRLDIKGRAGHAGYPTTGENALYRAAGIINSIQSLNDELQEDSVAVTKAETSNTNINIIPETCSIYCDYRAGVGRSEAEILDKLRNLVEEKDDVNAITPYYSGWEMDAGHQLVRAAEECLQKELGEAEVMVWNFCTNGSFSAGVLGIPTIGFGPGVETDAHSAGERIEIRSVIQATSFFSRLPQYIAGIKDSNE